MRFWPRSRSDAPSQTRADEHDPAGDAPPDVARLRALGTAIGPREAEAASIFHSLRSSPHEAAAIDAIREAAAQRAIFESIRVAAGAALVDRGETDAALAWLEEPRREVSAAARLIAADLRADRGEIASALALVERVLLADIHHPGARERHRRWQGSLGFDARTLARADTNAATVVTREPDSPFVLLREVARGGAGAVYEAEDRELRRRVALKVYHHADRDRVQLLHEARVAAALAGRGVVSVLDVDADRAWLALEWAPGGSLRELVRQRTPARVATLTPIGRWAVPLAEALARVHAARWVHHDLKPANVLFGTFGRPLLADFGTARRVGEPSPAGSLGYVSPERLAGRASDPRDDVFGFGRVLEDALDAVGTSDPDAASALVAWRTIATACTGADAARPDDARALLTRIRVETSDP